MSKRILVIDDDEGIRMSFMLALERTGYQVDTAESGERGVAMEKEGEYDLIFLDLRMPGMDGIETLREIRKRNRAIPIYIVTAFYKEYFDELKAAAEEDLVFELLKKPVGKDEIVNVVTGVLEQPVGIEGGGHV